MISSLYWPYLIADYYHALEIVSAVVAVIILLSSIDDLFIDAWYWVREAWRSLTVRRRYQPLKAEQLMQVEEKPLAIMVPAWLEYDVIAPMLESMVGTLDYKNYMIFVGTYRNEVERMRRRYRQLSAWRCRMTAPPARPTASTGSCRPSSSRTRCSPSLSPG
jgi:adsorption protein B